MPETTDMEHILAHRAEQVLAGRKGLGWAADDYRQGRGCRAVRAAADRSIEHGDTLGAEAFGKTARGKRVDRAHAQDDVTLFGGLDNPLLAKDHGLGLIGGLDHADCAMAFGGNGFGRGFDGGAGRD